MSLPKYAIYWAKQVRAWVKPFKGVSAHLSYHMQETAKSLHFQPTVISQLAQDASETCRQLGFDLPDDTP